MLDCYLRTDAMWSDGVVSKCLVVQPIWACVLPGVNEWFTSICNTNVVYMLLPISLKMNGQHQNQCYCYATKTIDIYRKCAILLCTYCVTIGVPLGYTLRRSA